MAGQHRHRRILVRVPAGAEARGGGLRARLARPGKPWPRLPRYTADTEAASRAGYFTT
jgi:hypothetical protein